MSSEGHGQLLSNLIRTYEESTALSKQSMQAAYQDIKQSIFVEENKELIELLKERKHAEERFLKQLRQEKTYLNAGTWEWAFREEGK